MHEKLCDEYKEELAAAAAAATTKSIKSSNTTLDRMMVATLAHSSLSRAVKEADAELRTQVSRAQEVAVAREKAERHAREMRAALRNFEPMSRKQHRHKRQKSSGPLPSMSSEESRQHSASNHVDHLGSPISFNPEEQLQNGSFHVREVSSPTEEHWSSREYANYSTVQYWRQEEGRIYHQRRRTLSDGIPGRLSKEMPRGNRDGPLDHWRCGLVGAIQYWAQGSNEDAATVVLAAIKRLGLEERIRERLFNHNTRDAMTALMIAGNVRAALHVNQACATEEQRKEYLIGLAYVSPPRAVEGDSTGCIRRIADFLQVRRGR